MDVSSLTELTLWVEEKLLRVSWARLEFMRKIAEPLGFKMQIVSPKVLLPNSVQPGGRARLNRCNEAL